MFCNKCGNEIKEGEKFCSKCGNKIKKRKKIIISIGIILLVILICGILYIGITVNKQFNKINNNTNSEIQVNNINSNGNGNENNLKVEDLVKVGDFVNYIPQNTVKSYTFLGNYTGQIGLDKTVYQETLQWRVLNINDNGTIDLISSTPTESEVTFRGALGYNNGVYLLNDFCNKIYGNSSIDATARNLNIEDIQDKMDLNVWDYHDYIYESSTKKIKYGEAYNHSNAAQIYYPYQWKLDKGENNKIDGVTTNGTMNESEQHELTTEADFRANTSIDIQQTFWTRDRMDMISNYKKVETRRNVNDSNIYYELFYSQAPNAYWLSSRGVDCKNNTFGLRSIIEGQVSIAEIYHSSTPPKPVSQQMRPVVTIPSSAIDLSSNYNEIGMWELK